MVLIMRVWMLLFLVLTAFVVRAESVDESVDKTPRFESYSVADESVSNSVGVKITDEKSRQYRSMLRLAAKQKPNFSGHYVLASWGCGASCIMAAAIDAKTGLVKWLPFTVCCWPPEVLKPMEFNVASRLLVVRGSRNEEGGGTYYYEFDGEQFLLIAEH